MASKPKQRLCRICTKRPRWKYKNCPPGACKRCYHEYVWRARPSAPAKQGPRETVTGELDTRPTVHDGYYGCFVLVEHASTW